MLALATTAPHATLRLGAAGPSLLTPPMPSWHHRRRLCAVDMQQLFGDDDEASPAPIDEAFLEGLESDLQRASTGDRGRGVFRRSRQSRRPRPQRQQQRVSVLDTFSQLAEDYDRWVSNPGQELLLGSLALLFGNFLAHYLDTTFGQSGFWETISGGVTMFVVELISREYYITPGGDRTATLKLLNALKVGLLYGLTLDALKVGG